MAQKSQKKNQKSRKREGAFKRLREDTAPGNSSDRTMFSMVRLSEGHCYEAFQKIGLPFNSCGMKFYREKKIQKLARKRKVWSHYEEGEAPIEFVSKVEEDCREFFLLNN